jgi:hypothetical protein
MGGWVYYLFGDLKRAGDFTLYLSQHQDGTAFMRSWERPKRQKGGYRVSVCTDDPSRMDVIASDPFSGERR